MLAIFDNDGSIVDYGFDSFEEAVNAILDRGLDPDSFKIDDLVEFGFGM